MKSSPSPSPVTVMLPKSPASLSSSMSSRMPPSRLYCSPAYSSLPVQTATWPSASRGSFTEATPASSVASMRIV
ncbi:hypothetical protein AB0D65_14795 [Streptomyces griseoloalbus]|uniref:Uncharacterized protein n=1 Tax=Streptomyces griseoloalbus TaxID=67303 RepID=A0ABV3E527_9ACTN